MQLFKICPTEVLEFILGDNHFMPQGNDSQKSCIENLLCFMHCTKGLGHQNKTKPCPLNVTTSRTVI